MVKYFGYLRAGILFSAGNAGSEIPERMRTAEGGTGIGKEDTWTII